METKLKPCPCCGGEAMFRESNTGHPVSVKVICDNCNATTEEIREDISYCAKDEVAKIWNRRKDDNLCVPKANTNEDKLWFVHCYNYFESERCEWRIRDGFDRRISELDNKQMAEKICEEHNKYFSEE